MNSARAKGRDSISKDSRFGKGKLWGLSFLILVFAAGVCQGSEFDPIFAKGTSSQTDSFPKTVSRIWIRFFQKFISPYDGPKCGLRPTCSQYSQKAIGRYGFFKGWMMSSDRLLRCHPKKEVGFYRMHNGHIHDSPGENDMREKERYDLFNSEWNERRGGNS